MLPADEVDDESGMNPAVQHASLKLPSLLACVDPIEHLAMAFARIAGFEEQVITDVGLATREAAVNAVVHGNRSFAHATIQADVTLTAAALTVRILDQGAGFERENVADPLHAANLLRPSGRGVFLIGAIMDDVHFSRQSAGFTITLVKHRAEEGSGDSTPVAAG